MTVRPAVVIARLAHLGDVLAQLERLRALDERQRAEPLYELAAERAIHVAIEAILDVGHHVLAGRGLRHRRSPGRPPRRPRPASPPCPS